MLTGRQTLQQLNEAHQKIRTDLARLNDELTARNDQLAQNGKAQATAYLELARLRLNDLTNQETSSSLGTLESTVEKRLIERRRAFQDLQTLIQTQESTLNNLQNERSSCETRIEDYAEQVDVMEPETRALLEANADYRDAQKDAEEAVLIADSANEKLQTALKDFSDKTRVYENEPLFMYLWKQGYGSDTYSAFPLIRWLDGWVASLCDYDKARTNYWNLQELPKRLRQHANNVEQQATQARTALAHIEQTLLKGTPYDKAVTALQTEQHTLLEIDQRFDTAEASLNKLLNQETDFAKGQDPHMQACLDIVVTTLKRKDVENLRMESLRTANSEDDRLVEKISLYEAEETELEDLLTTLRRSQVAQNRKLSDMEQVRRDFKSKRFDSYQSGFSNERLINAAIGGLIEGVLSGVDVWSTLEKNRRQRPRGHHKMGRPRFNRTVGRSNKSRGGFRTGGGF